MLKEMYYWMIYFIKKIGTTELTEFNAYLLICILLFANFGTFIVVVSYLIKFDLKTLSQDIQIIGIVFGLSIMIPNYFLLFAKRKEIIEKYNHLPQKRRIIGIISFWIYSIVSIPLFFNLVTNLTR